MKKLLSLVTIILILISSAYAIAGFGLHLDRSMYSVAKTTKPLTVENVEVASIIHHGFDNGFGIGGYLYIDAIPIIDIDLEGNLFDCSGATPIDDCDDIEENYLVLHSGEFAVCEYDIDCMPVWGHCDVSLGGCHYAVNSENYPGDEIEIGKLGSLPSCAGGTPIHPQQRKAQIQTSTDSKSPCEDDMLPGR